MARISIFAPLSKVGRGSMHTASDGCMEVGPPSFPLLYLSLPEQARAWLAVKEVGIAFVCVCPCCCCRPRRSTVWSGRRRSNLCPVLWAAAGGLHIVGLAVETHPVAVLFLSLSLTIVAAVVRWFRASSSPSRQTDIPLPVDGSVLAVHSGGLEEEGKDE